MADNIYQDRDGNDAFFWRRKPAWHRKGTKLPEGATMSEAQTAAGHNFEVEKAEITAGGVLLENHVGIQRTDNLDVLGIVRPTYQIIQPDEVYDVLRPVIGETSAHLECGGVLGRGEKMWLLAKFPQQFYVPGVPEDIIENYVLIVNSFDGSLALTLRSTPVRVVCQNTLDYSFRHQAPMEFRIYHRSGARDQAKLAHRAVGLITQHSEYIAEAAGRLVKIQMGARAVGSFLKKLLPSAPEREGEGPTKQTREKRDRIELLFSDLDRNNLPGMRGTAWALLQAVFEWADHEKPLREGVNELERLWFGSVPELKAKAARLLLAQLKGGDDEGVG